MKAFLLSLVCCGLWLFALSSDMKAQNSHVQIELVRSYPELRVDGKPFFPHSAAFFYSRLPRDQWEKSLRKHAELGINTIDLYIQWNWHEPREGQFDFDGHSNPRDLQGLLRLISHLGFKLIIRPGPVILNEWKNGGYPDWLLQRPEYKETLQDVLEGRYPRLSGLSTTQSDEASRQWLENELHLKYTRQWFFDVMKVLSPYLSSRNGNILFFQLDDDQAINRSNYSGPNFWRYMEALRQDLVDAAVSTGGRSDDIIPFINPTDMRVSAAGFDPTLPHPIAAMGQWYMYSGNNEVSFEDSANLQFFVEELKTQPRFPPMMIEFQAGWYVPGEDTYARPSDPENTLLASRMLFAHGLRGLNYFPLQDTLYPAGYEVPWTNHYYAWEAALDLNSNDQPRSVAVRRNGNLIHGMGSFLAQTHKQADVGIVYSLGASQPQEKLTREDILRISNGTIALQRYCMLNQVSNEYFDPEYQSVDQLGRRKMLLMPVFDFEPGRGLVLSPTAEKHLAEFVEQGGTLVFFPRAPEGGLLGSWFAGLKRTRVQGQQNQGVVFLSERASKVFPRGEIELYPGLGPGSDLDREFQVFARYHGVAGEPPVGLERKVGSGRVLVLGMDFFSWVANRVEGKGVANEPLLKPGSSPEESPQSRDAQVHLNGVIDELMTRAVVSRVLQWSIPAQSGEGQEVDVELATTNACTGYGFLSLMNFSASSPHDLKLSVVGSDPCLSAVDLPSIHLLPKDALWLPVHLPLKGFVGGENEDEIVASNSELFAVQGKSDHFQMGFYAPGNGELILKLTDPAKWRFLAEGQPITAVEEDVHHWVRVPIPASPRPIPVRFIEAKKLDGAYSSAPSGFQKQELERDYQREENSHGANAKEEVRFSLHSGYQLPIRDTLSIALDPPILVLNSSAPSKLLLEAMNQTSQPEKFSVDIRVGGYRLESSLKKIKLEPRSVQKYEFNLYLFLKTVIDPHLKFAPGKFLLKSRHKTYEMNFSMVTIDHGTALAYVADLDRDGDPEVVLENSQLRLIVTPGAGARAFVLFDKRSHKNCFTSVGSLRDRFFLNNNLPAWKSPRQLRGYFGLHNRPYRYEILASGGATAIVRFTYDAPDVVPGGALIRKTITLHGSARSFEVEYEVTPHSQSMDTPQAFISMNSVAKENLEEGSTLTIEPVGPSSQLIDHTERVSREHSDEVAIYFKPFEQVIHASSYRIRYVLPEK